MYELTISLDFEAAHCIQGYPGKCQRLHGHNWRVEVTVCGETLNELGMLVDFHDLKDAAKEVLGELDHHYLNELEAFRTENPTAENLARHIYDSLEQTPLLQTGAIRLTQIKVWESPHSAVAYTRPRIVAGKGGEG